MGLRTINSLKDSMFTVLNWFEIVISILVAILMMSVKVVRFVPEAIILMINLMPLVRDLKIRYFTIRV